MKDQDQHQLEQNGVIHTDEPELQDLVAAIQVRAAIRAGRQPIIPCL
jgi:hypothetical protein